MTVEDIRSLVLLETQTQWRYVSPQLMARGKCPAVVVVAVVVVVAAADSVAAEFAAVGVGWHRRRRTRTAALVG